MTSPWTPGRHLVLVGPTASGKSAAAVHLARRRIDAGLPVEIVSCDSMAVYRHMDIGTATPTVEERGGVPHHLLDVVDPSEEFSLQRFVHLVHAALDGIQNRGAAALLVGGTGLYVQAVVDGFRLPGRYPEVAADLEAFGTGELQQRLTELDPLAASRVPPGNRRRLIRALEVTIGSGRPFSAYGPGIDAYGPTPFVLTGLVLPREQLRARIRFRFERQISGGLLEEVRHLAARPDGMSRTAAGALGYRELLAHLRGEIDLDDAIALAVRRTQRFAVRQQRWFRRDRRIAWFAASDEGSRVDSDDGTSDRLEEDLDRHWSDPVERPVEAAAEEVPPTGGPT